MSRTVTVNRDRYEVLDRICHVTLADSFTKIKTGSGHGEAKLYVGTGTKAVEFWEGLGRCFFLKSDLQHYMSDSEYEYRFSTDRYYTSTPLQDVWRENSDLVGSLDSDDNLVGFDITRVNVQPPRYYIRSEDGVWDVFRSIILPAASQMTIFKLRHLSSGQTTFYFKPYIETAYNRINHRELINQQLAVLESMDDRTERLRLVNARLGLGYFKDELLREWSQCAMTAIDDQRILVASHIKPWVQSDNAERLNKFNGMVLSPTFNKLFEYGLITFDDDGSLDISMHLSEENMTRLDIESGSRYNIPHLDERSSFLDYHRRNVFLLA